MTQLRTVQVLGGGSAGSSAHVRSLASGLVARGVRVTVCAPAELDRVYDYLGVGAHFVPLPRLGDPATVTALRNACIGADVVHAHGLQASVRAALALSGGAAHAPLVTTWDSRCHVDGPGGGVLRMVERRTVRAATVVLATSSELVDRARRRGARDARLAPVTVPPARGPVCLHDGKARAELGAVDRPLLMAVGALERGRGYRTLLDAARVWRELDPQPLLVIAGEGRERAALQRRIVAESLPVRLIGRREDVAELLAAADVAVLPSRWEARSLLAQEALRLGVPLVATAVGGVPELVGDAAELVPYGDAEALALAVRGLLEDVERRMDLAAAGRVQAGSWPTEDETVAHVLSVYDELAGR
ncbi:MULTISPECIES: glycosyltransferase family 4 protein [Streptomyces]|uniref:Putative glycosyl transferase n=3 Tax=Streptomyces venezuelae TaxID=54571 RepID=F2RFC3_STRVP|nr:glycosyltransferase family 4 protein [Streptomyces venezuelae]APE20772.1 glycosyltransferase [Streptomyces venezuelae]QER98162.1 glycosyltransferase family 1 protein [Streptomyces venezuelae ATCC 10712]QES05364.1 glycosyltransferase family 1 protein [Streptomyces venezuelae]CCA54703.1 putative glycosyl transferase [Streptomyces venezuelae ATCC 10712]